MRRRWSRRDGPNPLVIGGAPRHERLVEVHLACRHDLLQGGDVYLVGARCQRAAAKVDPDPRACVEARLGEVLARLHGESSTAKR